MSYLKLTIINVIIIITKGVDMLCTIALFGEAEKGRLHYPYRFKDLLEMAETLGNPPENSKGLLFATQALLYQRELIYLRVAEEGFSLPDYFEGFKFLKDTFKIPRLDAIILPGVGDQELIEACQPACSIHKSFLILTEKDLFDYLTYR